MYTKTNFEKRKKEKEKEKKRSQYLSIKSCLVNEVIVLRVYPKIERWPLYSASAILSVALDWSDHDQQGKYSVSIVRFGNNRNPRMRQAYLVIEEIKMKLAKIWLPVSSSSSKRY
jgi:hypothetical protein